MKLCQFFTSYQIEKNGQILLAKLIPVDKAGKPANKILATNTILNESKFISRTKIEYLANIRCRQ